jgi:hypothetical protein
MQFLFKLWSYRQFILGAALVLFFALFLRQCKETQSYKDQLHTAKQIAEQNVAALKDKEIQLRVTKDQLHIIDSNLYSALQKIDSLGHIKSTVITTVQPVYVGKAVSVKSELINDSINHKYGLKFLSENFVRTIGGVSWFRINNTEKLLEISADTTNLNLFKLNFVMVVSQYVDPVTKFTKTKIIPFNVKPDGSIGEEIPKSLLDISFRNAEILDKPYTPNKPSDPAVIKRRIESGIGLTVTPLAVGAYPVNGSLKIGWTPNIGLSYYVTLKKK